ncbi:MAG TPA: PepSY-associated TM helix domain-containing protein [Bryobacteraceae bacterium]|nr:PepSY-associated TM helix domain-containing protein [Bryobacteraceae bacterium]
MATEDLNLWQRWLRRPQGVWLRRALFQIHLWTGIGTGLYVLLISVTGSAIVFRNEIYQSAGAGARKVEVRGAKLPAEDLKKIIREKYPTSSLSFVFEGKQPTTATEVWLERGKERIQRLFDPYTGADLGDSVPRSIRVEAWLAKLHTDLLYGDTGRKVNGVGAIFLTLLCISGAIIWWPGSKSWRRSLAIDLRSNWKRLNWDLHSAIGFWSFALIFMWSITGVYLGFPLPFQKVINHYSTLIQYALPEEVTLAPASPAASLLAEEAKTPPPQAPSQAKSFNSGKGRRQPIRRSAGDNFIRWIYYLHFGNFAGWKTKALWVVLGLLPVVLFVTGAIMWWNRVLSPAARRARSVERSSTVTVTATASG